jgi:hypothetical protein
MIYTSYSADHVSAYNNTFTDVPGDYVRFRDQSDYGTVLNNTFKSTKTATAQAFVSVPLFNDVDPKNNPNNLPMELFGTHYTVVNNNFSYSSTGLGTLFSMSQTGYEPPGTNYFPPQSDAALIATGDPTSEKTVLKNDMGIDGNEIHFYGNTPKATAKAATTAAYSAATKYGSTSVDAITGKTDWTGGVSISASLNTTALISTNGFNRVNWQFGAGEGWTNNSTASLQSAGWQFRAGTSSNANAYINTTQAIDGATGVMYLGDSISSQGLSADYKFQRLITGSMQWRMALTGAGSSFGLSEGRVNENGLSPLGVELLDSHTLRVLTLGSHPIEETFTNVDFGTALDWRLDWTSDPDGVNGYSSLWIKDANGNAYNIYANHAFETNLVPDTVWFDTSDNVNESNSIVLDSLNISASVFPSLTGDFNHDGIVDAADYIVWRQGGAAYTQNDYNNWRANFGQTIFGTASGASLNGGTVPETMPLAILLCAYLAMPFSTRNLRIA